MDKLTSMLTDKEISKAKDYYNKFKPEDSSNIIKIIEAIDGHAEYYFEDSQHKHYARGDPYFVVYAIGGCITKKGERPDIDLLIATNMWYSEGPYYRIGEDEEKEKLNGYDYFFLNLEARLNWDFDIKILNKLPDNYSHGAKEIKGLIEFKPKKDGKKIDLVYLRAIPAFHIDSEQEFIKLDVDDNDQPLPKLILYRNKTVKSGLEW